MFCPISDPLPNGMYAPVTILDVDWKEEVSVVNITKCLEEKRKEVIKRDLNEKLF